MALLRHHAPPPLLRLAAHPLRWRLVSELARSDLRVRELVDLVSQPQSLVSYHLRLLRDGGLVTASRSSHDGRDSYYHLDLDRCADALTDAGVAVHPGLRLARSPVPEATGCGASVLFVCTGNSARSPIAEALLHHHTGGRVSVSSAGTRPRPRIHPGAVRALREGFGIDIRSQRPRQLAEGTGPRFDHVITLCDKAREACPELESHPGRAHWSVRDPAAVLDANPEDEQVFRRTAADINTRIRHFIPALAHPPKEEAS